MRIAIAGEESLQAYQVGAGGRPDQHWAAGAGLDQCHSAQDQRTHDALPEFGFGDQQCA